MPKRMGRALLAALRKEPAPVAGPREPVLGNAQRRRVFQHFCLHPCGAVGEAARALGLAPATVRFHLRRLAQAEYVAPAGPSYAPPGLIEPGDLPLFEALASGPARRVLTAVYADVGLPVGELARVSGMSRTAVASLLDAFEPLRLVSRVADGRFVRVYPTRALEEKRDRQRPRARNFCERLLRRLEAEGETPEVLRRTATELQVRFGRGPAKATLEVALDPYSLLLLGS